MGFDWIRRHNSSGHEHHCCDHEQEATPPASVSIIADGDFQDPIGIGGNVTPWADWTNAGATRSPAPSGLAGDYASLPIGTDLYQNFATLAEGDYELAFFVRNESASAVKLTVGVQTIGGNPASLAFANGTTEVLDLAASSGFMKETLDFSVTATTPFPINQLTFSNSYDGPIPGTPLENSINPPGTIIDVAEVSLVNLNPAPPPSAIILDGDFLNPIGIGANVTPWADWTDAGVTRSAAPSGVPGDYASMPVGADLYQNFAVLPNGDYELSFYVRNESAAAAKLTVGVQTILGTPAAIAFANGTTEVLDLAASSGFVKETFDFSVTPTTPFSINQLTFSNSYDAPVPGTPLENSINAPGTIIDVADVSLVLVPTAAATCDHSHSSHYPAHSHCANFAAKPW